MKYLERSSRSAKDMEARATAEARRRACAEAFRARLLADLAEIGARIGAGQDALVCIAVSAYCELQELSGEFLRAKAGQDAMNRMRFCRSELRRTLAALGLAAAGDGVEEPGGAVASDSPIQWLASRSQPPQDASDDGGPLAR